MSLITSKHGGATAGSLDHLAPLLRRDLDVELGPADCEWPNDNGSFGEIERAV